MGRPPRLAVSLEHQHLTAGTGTEARTAQAPNSASNHQNVDVASNHPRLAQVIIVIGRSG